MKKLTHILFVLALIVAHLQTCEAATLALRNKSQHHGAMIYLGDVADISAESRSELHNLKTTALMPAPAPGTLQYLSATQVRDLLASQGIDVHRLSFRGADSIELGQPMPKPKQPATEKPVRSTPEVEAEVEAAIIDYLMLKTGHDRWRVEFDLETASFLHAANAQDNLRISGGRRPWTGQQTLKISTSSTRAATPMLVSVHKIQEVVVAVRDISRGNLIRTSDLEVRLTEGNVSNTAVTSISQIVGMEASRSIRANQPILQSHYSAPQQVARGETVTVFARTQGISVRTFAIAKQDGALGDLIQVETLDKKDRFVARISGRKELEVLAAGATAGEYASLPRHDGIQR